MIHCLQRISRRVLNRPQLITPDGALAVLSALAPRANIARVALANEGGALVTLEAPEIAARNEQARARADGREDRCFAFDPETGIAYLPIEGELVHRYGHIDPCSGLTGYDGITVKVQEAAADPAVRGILLDIDSPGGELYGCDGCAEAIYRARQAKPVWAIANELAASAAYWLASAADVLVVPRTGDAGSIGVVMMHADMSGAMDKAGITVTLIHAGAHKVDGNPYQALPKDVQSRLQAECETARGLFVESVARYRGRPASAFEATEALVYMGEDAVTAGLADAVADFDETYQEFARSLAAAGTAAGTPASTSR